MSHSEIPILSDLNEYWSSYLTSGKADLSAPSMGGILQLGTQPERAFAESSACFQLGAVRVF